MILTIGWLYPELMSTYGDRGNIMVLTKRCVWRGIEVRVLPITFETKEKDLHTVDLIFGGGAQDRQQGILIDDLRVKKGPVIKELINNGIPGLFVCGSPQLLGEYYMNGDGEKLEGLDIFPMVSRHFGKDKPRCIGNVLVELDGAQLGIPQMKSTLVGFENHGGRTYLADGLKPLGKVLSGFGNNGEDKTEGAIYKHCIATYSHGPFLPKNPHIADYLIKTALEVKYKKTIELHPLDDSIEWKAHDVMVKRLRK